MLESTCRCGAVLAGEDMDRLVAAGVDHFGTAHPEYELTAPSIRNYFEAEQRLDGPTDRLDSIGEIDTYPIGPERLEDILEFFDRRVFADNPAWGMCYCMFHHIGGRYAGEWSQRTWQQNRHDLAERIGAGTTTGVVAYVDGVLAGWCNASARSAFPSHLTRDGEDVGSIACFAVAPPYRGHGLSRALLDGALELLADQGRTVAEAYPVSEPRSRAAAYVGALDLYLAAGFEVVSDDPLVVRKSLA